MLCSVSPGVVAVKALRVRIMACGWSTVAGSWDGTQQQWVVRCIGMMNDGGVAGTLPDCRVCVLDVLFCFIFRFVFSSVAHVAHCTPCRLRGAVRGMSLSHS